MKLSKLALTVIAALSIGTSAYGVNVPWHDRVLDVNKITSIVLLGDISHYMHSDLTDSQQAALKKQREKLIAQGVKPDPVYEMSFEAPGYDDLYAIAESKRQKIIANATVKADKVQEVDNLSKLPEGEYICKMTDQGDFDDNDDYNKIRNGRGGAMLTYSMENITVDRFHDNGKMIYSKPRVHHHFTTDGELKAYRSDFQIKMAERNNGNSMEIFGYEDGNLVYVSMSGTSVRTLDGTIEEVEYKRYSCKAK